jgi:hypothetical protein
LIARGEIDASRETLEVMIMVVETVDSGTTVMIMVVETVDSGTTAITTAIIMVVEIVDSGTTAIIMVVEIVDSGTTTVVIMLQKRHLWTIPHQNSPTTMSSRHSKYIF